MQGINELKRIFLTKKKVSSAVTTVITTTDSGVVHTVGDETIDGEKTFLVTPVIPEDAPTTDEQVANKKYVDDSIAALTGHIDNFSATTDPTTSDDNTDGYSIGSFWINTVLDKVYQCIDASTGAAVWAQLNSVVVDDAPSDGQTYGRKNGSWFAFTGGGGESVLLLTLGLNDWLDLYTIDFTTNSIIIPS